MLPILFDLPGLGLKVHAYGVMILLACTGALGISAWRAGRERLNVGSVYELAAWLFLGGVIGARALYLIQHPGEVHSVADLVRGWQGGNVFYGCIIGGLIGTSIYWRRHPFPFWPMADVVAPALAVGITLGRVGCLLAGCCFGSVCDHGLGMRFPAGSHAWAAQIEQGLLAPAARWSLPVHPTQLYAAVSGLLILIFLSWYFPRRRRDGEVMAWLMVLYAASRWLVEGLRGDEPAILAGMTLSQNISLGLLALGALVWLRLLRSPPGRFADESADLSEWRPNASERLNPWPRESCWPLPAASGHRRAGP